MKTITIAMLLCWFLVSCAGPQAVATSTKLPPLPSLTATVHPTVRPSPAETSNERPKARSLPSATSIPTITTTPLPASIVEGASRSGLAPEEIVAFYWELHSYLEHKDADALANKVYFPLNECGREKGDNIETGEEFIRRFHEIFTDEIIASYLHADLEETQTTMYGVYIGGVWFGGICSDKSCDTVEIWLLGVNRYCAFRITPPMEESQVTEIAALPDYSGASFVYGTYQMESYKDEGGLLPQEEIDKLKSVEVRIEKNRFSSDQDCHFGCSCASPEYEFNRPFYDRGRALWYGIPVVGELIVICDGTPSVYFDVLADNKVGYYYYGYYITLVHQEKSR